MCASPDTLRDRKGRIYEPAVGAKLKKLLLVLFAVIALLGANSFYLVTIRILGPTVQNWLYPWMFLMHLVLGLLIIAPFMIFAVRHLWAAWGRTNRRAVRAGVALLITAVVLIVSGVTLLRLPDVYEVKNPTTHGFMYTLHVITPLFAIALYIVHRRAGPRIQWKWGYLWGTVAIVMTGGLAILHHEDPRQWNLQQSREGLKYFDPSEARTKTGGFISEEILSFDCRRCHEDVYQGWFHSAHHLSSFNNPPYLFSISETRDMAQKRDGNLKASRWCAGCHDPVPFFAGKFDDPDFDIHNDPTAHAGITCVVCHSITDIRSTIGNAAYVIEEPTMYPFAQSDNPIGRWLHDTLVKANPTLHKNTFLKSFHRPGTLSDEPVTHRQPEFCSTCHKVSLPFALNHYKTWLRGQNHYDPYLLSGVSGHGAQSFYYPETAIVDCATCHMPLVASTDFGARQFDGLDELKVHSHLFPAANTAIPYMYQFTAKRKGNTAEEKSFGEAVAKQQEFLKDSLRVDIFGIKEGGTTEGVLHAPLRPELPLLEPGKEYLIEVVIRTLTLGHLFTQGTVDSNEVWIDFEAHDGKRVIGRSGAIDEKGEVDPWSHFVNVLLLDRDGNRIDRRNAADIFVPLYNHQIPPGAAQIVHFRLRVPSTLNEAVHLTARLNYRKFDYRYMQHVYNDPKSNPNKDPIPVLPVTTIAQDSLTLPVKADAPLIETASPTPEAWMRWNDYGIACLLETGLAAELGELRQAEEAFRQVIELGKPDGWTNLARVYLKDGRVQDAEYALTQASENELRFPWVATWLGARVAAENSNLDSAIELYQAVLDTRIPRRRFDFSKDYRIRNALAATLVERANQERTPTREAARLGFLNRAREEFERVLTIDSENETAHYNLSQLHQRLGNEEEADHHQTLYLKYHPDSNARDLVIQTHRRAHPAANHAAQAVVIYNLHRDEAPGFNPVAHPVTSEK